MELHWLIALSMLIPAAGAVLNPLLARWANLRDSATLLAAIGTFVTVLAILARLGNATSPTLTALTTMKGLDIAFNVEPLGLMFALIASGLWIVTHAYGVGYMRGNRESGHTRFFAAFCLSIAAVMGLAFAANLFTLFLFYELLTLSTFSLVAHKGTPEAMRGAKTYLGILMGTSIALFLVAVIWTWAATGSLDFAQGGFLKGKLEGWAVPALLALFAFGIGKAALMPFHRWLPAAMVAPTPVSALLHAVAVVKAGVFTMLKVGIYVFGVDFLAETGAAQWLMWLAAWTILAASVVAMTKDNLKARLAYSTVSQLAYVTLGMALATSMGALGGGLQIATHALGKITLFMAAGSIYVATHKTLVSQLDGLGRAMPLTFGAFLLGALSIIGLPPLGGSWSKWLLIVGAADAGQKAMIAVLMLSSLLNIAYLLPVVGRGFFLPPREPEAPGRGLREASVLLWLPPVLTALGAVLLFFLASGLLEFLTPIVESPEMPR